jgi:hypothetical protein
VAKRGSFVENRNSGTIITKDNKFRVYPPISPFAKGEKSSGELFSIGMEVFTLPWEPPSLKLFIVPVVPITGATRIDPQSMLRKLGDQPSTMPCGKEIHPKFHVCTEVVRQTHHMSLSQRIDRLHQVPNTPHVCKSTSDCLHQPGKFVHKLLYLAYLR